MTEILKSVPSREFFVRQAVLNWAARTWPQSIEACGGVAPCLKMVLRDVGVGNYDRQKICDEYRALTSKYEVAL